MKKTVQRSALGCRIAPLFASLGALVAGLAAAGTACALPAFPGAEGFGGAVTGGRTGTVFHVTSLADSGAGTLRDALSQGNRTVVFDVGGLIHLTSPLVFQGDNVTVAGQSAPGDGITVYGSNTSLSARKNIILRYVRFRSGINSDSGSKALGGQTAASMIVDHVSVAWGRWDGMGFSVNSTNITVQDCLIGEGIAPQNFGGFMDTDDGLSILRTLWLDNQGRNPKLKSNGQYINNVVYDWGHTGGLSGGHSSAVFHEDYVNNAFIAGPSSNNVTFYFFDTNDYVYHSGNLADLDKNGAFAGKVIANSDFQYDTGDAPPTFQAAPQNKPALAPHVLETSAAVTYVLAHAGASLHRDAVDTRLVNQVTSYGTAGAVIDDEATVGGQPDVVKSTRAADFDQDRDGMADAWERAHGLDPNDAKDGAGDYNGDGYTNLEKYLNELAGSPAPEVSDGGAPAGGAGGTSNGAGGSAAGSGAAAGEPATSAAGSAGTAGVVNTAGGVGGAAGSALGGNGTMSGAGAPAAVGGEMSAAQPSASGKDGCACSLPRGSRGSAFGSALFALGALALVRRAQSRRT